MARTTTEPEEPSWGLRASCGTTAHVIDELLGIVSFLWWSLCLCRSVRESVHLAALFALFCFSQRHGVGTHPTPSILAFIPFPRFTRHPPLTPAREPHGLAADWPDKSLLQAGSARSHPGPLPERGCDGPAFHFCSFPIATSSLPMACSR